MYDAVAEALPLAQQGQNRKKALLVISDGNDTSSTTGIRDVKQLIRESEVLVYAIGIDGEGEPTMRTQPRSDAAPVADAVSVSRPRPRHRPWRMAAADASAAAAADGRGAAAATIA